MGEITPLPGSLGTLSAPAPLNPEHDRGQFDCGKPPLDDWLRQHAVKSDGRSARTYVVCTSRTVVGYYCLATGGARRVILPGKLRRNMPDPAPIMVLGRLAVARRHQGQGVGGGMVKDAMLRVLDAARLVGFRALTLHAKDEDAMAFYIRYGFVEFPLGTKTMFLPVETIASAI